MTYVLLIINAYSQFMLGLYFYFFEVRIKAQIPGGGGAHGNHIISSEAHKARGWRELLYPSCFFWLVQNILYESVVAKGKLGEAVLTDLKTIIDKNLQ